MNNSLKQLGKSLAERQISVKELTGEYLKRIAEQNPALNALVTVTEEEAYSAAENAQKMLDSGGLTALTGIPCVIKDNICTSGTLTTCGSKMLENFAPFYDAEVVSRLKALGYVPLGKANMDEFAMGNSNRTSHFGNVRNPLDQSRVPGGSSGGSAAAVAAGLCAYSLGTDTGGSIRQPAAFCGITGFKPTHGVLPMQGVAEFAGSFDTLGTFARTAEDCGVIADCLCPEVGFAAKIGRNIKGMKIALVRELFTDAVELNVREAVERALQALRDAGAEVSEVSMPSLPFAAPAYFCLASAEGVSALSRYDGVKYGLRGDGATYDEQLRDSRTRGFGDEVKRRLMLGNFVLSGDNMQEYFRKALAVKQRVCDEFAEVFCAADVIVSPTTMRTAFALDEPSDYVKIYASTMYTSPMNLAGLPCVSSPCPGNGEGLPAGITVTGRKRDDATVLQVADALDKSR